MKRISISIDENTKKYLDVIKRYTHINTTSQIIRMLIWEKALQLERKNNETSSTNKSKERQETF